MSDPDLPEPVAEEISRAVQAFEPGGAGPADDAAAPGSDHAAEGVPTFESIREKIEDRVARSIGSAELDAETPEGRTIEQQYEERRDAAAARLKQIRESMRQESPDAPS